MFFYFYILQWKKNQKVSADFWHRNMTLKTRIVLYLTFCSESIQIPRTFLWLFSLTFGLAYSPLNSTKLNCSSEVTLRQIHLHFIPEFFHNSAAIWFFKHKFLMNSVDSSSAYKADGNRILSEFFKNTCRISISKTVGWA